MKAFTVVLTLYASTMISALYGADHSSLILHKIQKLNTLGSVMYIAAHPDDENTRLLTWLANEKKFRTVYLSLTRGDGGQNLIGSEQGRMLGLIRTEELMAARRTDGAEQWFTNAFDFGYSKNPEETFRFWNREKVLAEVVFAIRKFRPDVIITRFPVTGEGGHGHHTASAMLAVEAFDKAGDPSVFPEQLSLVTVWQPRRLFWNTFNFGGNNTTAADQLRVDVGGYNPLLGMSYGEIAALSRSCHKSQGFGSALQRGAQTEYFKQLKGDSAGSDLFEGITTGWNRLGKFGHITSEIKLCQKSMDVTDPSSIIPALNKVYLMLSALKESDPSVRYWKQIKMDELKTIIMDCAGIWAESAVSDNVLVEDRANEYTTRFIVRNRADVKLLRISNSDIPQIDTNCEMRMEVNRMFQFRRKAALNHMNNFSDPYWMRHNAGGFTNTGDRYGAPLNKVLPVTCVTFSIEGLVLFAELPLVNKYTDPVKGELYRPVEWLPPVTVTPSARSVVVNGSNTATVSYLIRANTGNVSGRFVLQGGAGCRVSFTDSVFELKTKGEEKLIEVKIVSCEPGYRGFLKASLIAGDKVWDLGIERIAYDHIPQRFALTESEVSITGVQTALHEKKIAYIPGAGDEIPSCLQQIGYEVTVLSDDMLRTGDLSQYSAVVCGIRAYNTNELLHIHQPRLMEYVRKGGRFIVQYNTNSRVGPLQSNIGPYPFTITRNRVTDELAEVSYTDSASPILHYPNPIDSSDFKGWIQERGVYFAGEMDSSFRTVFAMRDPGESLQQGSLIWARFGKGVFVYTGLSFFRQLPAGVPGAYRLFVNLLSIPVGKE